MRRKRTSRDEEHQRTDGLSRRGLLAAGAAAATGALAPALGGAAARARQQGASGAAGDLGWERRFLDLDQARLLSQLCDLILPRTATPGALDAGVPEWIDLALSVDEPEEQLAFLGGLDWIDRRANDISSRPFLELPEEEQIALLREISDEHEELPPELEAGGAFFRELKGRTLFAYFTSKTGRVEALGMPEKVEHETFRGCEHEPGDSHRTSSG
jgi:hypothetical protein